MAETKSLPVHARLKSSGLAIGELARAAGVRASAVRYYEACGLMPAPARKSGRRVYGLDAADRLKAIAQARRLGFSIADLKRLAAMTRPERKDAARERAADLRAAMAQLAANAARLDALAECACEDGGACGLVVGNLG